MTWRRDPPSAAVPGFRRGARREPAQEAQTDDAPGVPPTLAVLEALLFVGGPPLSFARAREILRGLTAEQFVEGIETLSREYRVQGRPYVVHARGEGFELKLKPRYRGVIEKLYGTAREARLSTAAVDVLSLVAYRQPISKQDIDSLRGLDSSALLRQLVRRGLIALVQATKGEGEGEKREVLYGTTPRFLELFGLSGLDDLPRAQDLQPM
jgi:segregation and condensation protein B